MAMVRWATGTRKRGSGFLSRLRGDVRGNTIAMMAISLIPLTAMIGSGVDMTRAYMAQNRLRQACDAGSLAGRRLLAGTVVSPEVVRETTNYFRFNFPQGFFQSANSELTITAPTTGTLHVATETTIPTTLMKMFGFQTLPITAACSATQDFVNTDIMMVFDLSGSMNVAPGVPGGADSEQSGSKIGALRDAAKSLYDTLETAQNQLHDNNLRLRYGFVNYNSTVNVGRILYARNQDWFVQSASYQSRTPQLFDTTDYPDFKSKSGCESGWSRYSNVIGGWFTSANRCQVVLESAPSVTGYTYEARSIDVRSYLASNPLTGPTVPAPLWADTRPTEADHARVSGLPSPADAKKGRYDTAVWNGCIEERKTNAAAINGGTATYPPRDAYDLDIDLIPNSDDTRWRPMFNAVEYHRDANQPETYCPTEARRLREYYNDKAGFAGYIDGLRARGGTYHDIGVIWGARFISSTGLFKSSTPETNNQLDPDNPAKIRGFSVKKYMIFMTDGEMSPATHDYSAYGLEYLDGRVMGSPSGDFNALKLRHLQRFRMACNAAKAKGIDIWVIAFSTTLTSDMEDCASKPSQASGLSTRADLIDKFREIGSKIGALRLSQ